MKKILFGIAFLIIGNNIIHGAEHTVAFNPYRLPETCPVVDYSNKNISCITTPGAEDFNFILWYGPNITINALNLSNNHIHYLPSCMPFKHLYRLQNLNLAHNAINEIPPLTLVNPNLKKLDLSHNNITKLPSLADNDLIFLSELDLSANQISDISEATKLIQNLRNLETLNLKDNPLSETDLLFLRESFPDIEILF